MRGLWNLGCGLVLALATSCALAASPVEMVFDKGRVAAFYGADPASDPMHMVDAIKRNHVAESMASLASRTLYLRHDLQVGFESCGVPNAFFRPDRSAIVMCYEFVDLVARTAAADKAMMELPKPQFGQLFNAALWSVFLHELGHAVVFINRVPITGREEDVADQFSAWYAVNFLPPDRAPVIPATLWLWTRLAQQKNFPAMSDDQRRQFLANEHSLDEVRVYNIACLAAGARPQGADAIVSAVKLPAQRAERCPQEYAQVDFAMKKGFKKFFKVKPLSGSW